MDHSEGPGFEDLRRRVAATVRRQCPRWMAGQTEDIVQNAMLKLYRSVEKSDGKKSFSSVYLEKSVCGAVVDEIRRRCRRREDPVQDEKQLNGIAGAQPNPERGAFAQEIARGVVNCMGRLGRPRKLAVTLYLHGCSVPEAAGRLGWTLHKTESLVYRGLADLRTCLEKSGLKP